MCKLEDSIAELCPGGVEYKQLWEITNFRNGKGHEKAIKTYGQYIVVNSRFISTNGRIKKYSETQISPLFVDDILIVMSDLPNGRALAKCYLVEEDNRYTLNQRIGALSPKDKNVLYSKFLYYVLNRNNQLLKYNNGVDQTNLKKNEILNIFIPLPPLPIQEEIVRILDNFTELTTELTTQLTAELTARKQQYEYYRDSLLTFGDDVEWKTLGEIATDMYRGSGIKRDQVTESGIPCVRYGEIYTTYNIWFDSCVSHTAEKEISNKKYFEHGDVLFAITGERVEEIAKSCVYIGQEKCLAGGDTVVMKHNENPKYLAYALLTNNAQIQKSKGKVKSKVVHSSVPALREIKIPVPPLTEQARIVAILDRFDTLVNDITTGLPAEIEARNQQYEYYRDKLLTFKECER